MIYDLSKESDRISFEAKSTFLLKKNKKVELTEKRKIRTYRQNRYLHVILSNVALDLGYSLEEFKFIWKSIICPETFQYKKKDIVFYKSSSELDTNEMTIVIEKFRNYMMVNFGIYVPQPDESKLISQYETRITNNSQFL